MRRIAKNHRDLANSASFAAVLRLPRWHPQCTVSDVRWFMGRASVRTTLASVFVAACATSALGQASTWHAEGASGIAPTAGDISDRLTKLFTYNGLGVSDQALQAIRVPDGNARLLSLTAGSQDSFSAQRQCAWGGAVASGQSGAAFFAEVRYHYAHMKPTTTSIVPVTFGIRFSGGQ
jgi:hypothetical protein